METAGVGRRQEQELGKESVGNSWGPLSCMHSRSGFWEGFYTNPIVGLVQVHLSSFPRVLPNSSSASYLASDTAEFLNLVCLAGIVELLVG